MHRKAKRYARKESIPIRRSWKALSKLLAFIMIFTTALGNVGAITVSAADTASDRKIDVWDFGGVQTAGELYNNHITPEILDSKTTIKSGSFATTSYGDFTLANPVASDRSYYFQSDGVTQGVNSSGTQGYQKNTYDDGYISNGIFYANGTGGINRRFLTLDNVVAGDKVSVYGGLQNGGSETLHFVHAAIRQDGSIVTVTPDTSEVQDSTAEISGTAQRIDFIAQYSGSYQIYVTAAAGKPYFHRVTRTPGVKVSGEVNLNGSDIATGYSISFTNQSTNDVTTVAVNADHTFDAVLATGYEYVAALVNTPSYRFSDETKLVSTAIADIPVGKSISLDVVENQLVNIHGNLNGFDSSYDVSQLQIRFAPPEGSLVSPVTVTIDRAAMTYTADVQDGVAYTAVMTGVNDYEIVDGGSINISDDTIQNITVAKKAVYTVTGQFQGLSSTAEISSITFTNVNDGYVYTGTVANGGYTASLRDGAYSVSAASSENYSTSTHVVISGQNITKDILFVSKTPLEPLPLVQDLYVGDSSKEHNYPSVKEALAAAARMNPTSEDERITIHISPGVYRAQLIIRTPYITLQNAHPSPTSDESTQVKITWYYGIGYQYYSAGTDGYYNEERAFDQYAKNTVSKWGATVYITNSATHFKAKNIIFENSFNKYMTAEELADGVELDTNGTIRVERKLFTDVTSKEATERAAAIVIEGDNAEFINSSFLGSQDTLNTGNVSTNNIYIKNSYIDGNTDFIYGDGNVVFDNVTLNIAGYSNQAVGGYITAPRDSTHGYLFRNSTVTADNNKNIHSPAYFGRPWGANARAAFLNTKLQVSSIINPVGWTQMSGNQPENAHFREYNTSYQGVAVDTSQRVVPALTAAPAVNLADYFGDWIPTFYTPDSETAPTFKIDPFFTTDDDINIPYTGNTISLGYEFENANDNRNDSSLIQWYRVSPEGSEILIRATTAYISKTYKMTSDDVGYYIKAVVTPEITNGLMGEQKAIQLENLVREETSEKSTIWIIGDSTVSSFTDHYYYPRYGWGTQIGKYLDGSFHIQNIALSGRSSKSYTAEPQYQALLNGMKSGDFVLIGFGHNDQKAEAERYTNPNGSYLTPGSFANSLYKNYIKPAQAAGAQVILTTPIVRRTATGEWNDSNLHITEGSGNYAGGDYPKAIKNLGAALSIPVVDMTSLTKQLYDQLGPAETLYLQAWTSSKPASADNTHTNIWGGAYNAYLITKGIKEMGVSGLAEHVLDADAPTKADTLVPNPDYKDTPYTGELPQSALWADHEFWKGTVFGDIGGNPSIANQTLETDSDGNMHIAVTNNKGKIASGTDGIAMYYYQVPADSTFTLTAKAKINAFSSNDQVSFGLMARDEMYIDSNMNTTMGDYVAAAPLKLTQTGEVWNSFARKSGVLTRGGTVINAINVGDVIDLRLEGTSDGYATKFGNEATVTGGFDFKLTSIDPDYVYVGMFVARNADITFSDIKLVVNGVEVVHNPNPAEDRTAPTWINGKATATNITSNSLTLTWDGASDNVGVTGYRIYQGAALLASVNDSVYSFNATGLSAGTSYTFTVQAGDKAGNWSANGPSVTVRTNADDSDPVTPSPTTPVTPTEPTTPSAPVVTTTPGQPVFDLSDPESVAVLKAILTEQLNSSNQIVTFEDVLEHWSAESITLFSKLGVVNGYEDGTFKPDANITRGEFAAMIVRLFNIGIGELSDASFKDIDDSWAKDAILALASNGIINGYDDGTFRANANITRAEMIAIISRMINLQTVQGTSNNTFNDIDDSWNKEQIEAAAKAGIINGVDEQLFAPDKNSTRAEALTVLLRALKLNPEIAAWIEALK